LLGFWLCLWLWLWLWLGLWLWLWLGLGLGLWLWLWLWYRIGTCQTLHHNINNLIYDIIIYSSVLDHVI